VKPCPYGAWILLILGLAIESTVIGIIAVPYIADLPQKYIIIAGIALGVLAGVTSGILAYEAGKSLYKIHKQNSLVKAMINEVKSTDTSAKNHNTHTSIELCMQSRLFKELLDIAKETKSELEIYHSIKATQRGFLRRYGIIINTCLIILSLAILAFYQQFYLYQQLKIHSAGHANISILWTILGPILFIIINGYIMLMGYRYSFFTQTSKQAYKIVSKEEI